MSAKNRDCLLYTSSIIIGVQRNTERKKRKKVLKVCFITTHYKKRVL